MDRRRFLLTSLAGVLATPLAAEAQPAGKVYRIGCLYAGGDPGRVAGDAGADAPSPKMQQSNWRFWRGGMFPLLLLPFLGLGGQSALAGYRVAAGRVCCRLHFGS